MFHPFHFEILYPLLSLIIIVVTSGKFQENMTKNVATSLAEKLFDMKHLVLNRTWFCWAQNSHQSFIEFLHMIFYTFCHVVHVSKHEIDISLNLVVLCSSLNKKIININTFILWDPCQTDHFINCPTLYQYIHCDIVLIQLRSIPISEASLTSWRVVGSGKVVSDLVKLSSWCWCEQSVMEFVVA